MKVFEILEKSRPMYNYSRNVIWSEEDNCYIATSPEFQWISAVGDTPDEAFYELGVALKAAIETCKEKGWELPQPKKMHDYSGQFRLRLPKSLHRQLAEQANSEDVSLNTLVVQYLSAAIAEANIRSRRQQDVLIVQIHRDKAQISGNSPVDRRLLTEGYEYALPRATFTTINLLPVS